MSLFFPNKKEWISGITAGMLLFSLNPRGLKLVGTTRSAGLRSFYILLVTTPIWLVYSIYNIPEVYTHYNVSPIITPLVHLATMPLYLALTLSVIWLILGSEGKRSTFWHLVASTNWYNCFTTLLLLLPMMFLTNAAVLTHHQIQSVSTALYIYDLVCLWFIAYRTTGVNPFLAAGLAIIGPMIGTIISDYINMRIFGVMRPFEQQWFIDMYNSTVG